MRVLANGFASWLAPALICGGLSAACHRDGEVDPAGRASARRSGAASDAAIPSPPSATLASAPPSIDASADACSGAACDAEDHATAGKTVSEASPTWAHGTLSERLSGLRIGEDNWAQRTVYSWTTRAQIDVLRASHVLLVATARTGGPPSPFVFGIDTLARRRGGGASSTLAKALFEDPRFTRRRYAWTAAYATVLGLGTKRYGDQLLAVRLRGTSWVVQLDPLREPPMRVRDLAQHEISLSDALAHLERIGAVFHVRGGRDTPSPFREYVLVNADAVERWAVGTPDIHAEITAEAELLRELRGQLGGDAGALAAPWRATLAFENDRYGRLDARHLDATIEGLATYDAAQPALEVQVAAPP